MQYALFYIDFFVNNIQKKHHLTALNGDFIIVCVTFLIMPFIGLSPFLQRTKERQLIKQQCVNALYRAFSISTKGNGGNMVKEIAVSMPFIGLSPFLRSPLVTP